MKYTLDANILINMQRLYPKEIFPSLWSSLEGMAEEGMACICEAISREVARGGDMLPKWVKGIEGFVCETTEGELATVKEISVAHPGWVQGQKNDGDPFIIAHAKVEKRVVVTEEARKGPGVIDKNQKIPNIADEFDVDCLNFFEFVKEQGWRF